MEASFLKGWSRLSAGSIPYIDSDLLLLVYIREVVSASSICKGLTVDRLLAILLSDEHYSGNSVPF